MVLGDGDNSIDNDSFLDLSHDKIKNSTSINKEMLPDAGQRKWKRKRNWSVLKLKTKEEEKSDQRHRKLTNIKRRHKLQLFPTARNLIIIKTLVPGIKSKNSQ